MGSYSANNAKALAKDFQEYLEVNRDEIEALTIFYGQPHRRSALTYQMIRDVPERLRKDKPRLAPLRRWQAYALLDEYKGGQPSTELTALVALIRRVCGMTKPSHPKETVRRNFQNWIMQRHSGGGEKFNEEGPSFSASCECATGATDIVDAQQIPAAHLSKGERWCQLLIIGKRLPDPKVSLGPETSEEQG